MRPLWKGAISFGLVNIPVVLYPAESKFDLHFHLIDSRDNARIRYQRINTDTGEEVPWHDIAKAYEYEKGNYVVLTEKEMAKITHANTQTIEIDSFVDRKSVDSIYFEKPYYIVPDKRGEKGYALLREILLTTKKIGIAKVAIRSRTHIAAVIPFDNALIVNILRYDAELRKPTEFDIPENNIKHYKISTKELSLSKKLVESMTVRWNPKRHQDEDTIMLRNWLEHKIPDKTTTAKTKKRAKTQGNIVDIVGLLKKSLSEKTKQSKKAKPKTIKKKTKKAYK